MVNYSTTFPPAHSSTYVKATSNDGVNYPYLGTNPAKSLTGSYNNNSWCAYGTTQKKFNIDLGSAKRIRRVRLDNMHDNGSWFRDWGIKDCVLYGTDSSTAFNNVTYSDTTDLVLLASFSAVAHIASNVADPQYFEFDNTVEYRYYVLRIANNCGGSQIGFRRLELAEDLDWRPEKIYAYLNQPYKIEFDVLASFLEQRYGIVSEVLLTVCEQPYSLLLETWLQQIYGDVPELAAALHQPYSDAAVLNRSLLQPWADALQMQVDLDQPFALPETLQVAVEQRWGIVAAVLEANCEQLFHIEQNTTLFAGLCQPYAMLGEAARLHNLTTKLYVGGVRIPYVTLEWQATDSEFFWYCAFAVKSRAVADLCGDGAVIRIEHMGEEFHLKCYGGWLLDKRHAEETYRVEGYSRTRDFDEATPLRQDFTGDLASQIVADLAAPFSITVYWQMVDGWIADGKLTANDETPLAVIRNIVADMGGIIQTTPAGDLLIVAEEEVAIPDYPTEAIASTINASLERISTSEQKDEQKGYNKFVVSDQAAAGGQFALDYVEIDATTRELRLFVVPLEGRQFTLTSSGGSEVTIEPGGIVDLPIVDELIEFVAGSGRTQRPIHGISAMAWQRDNLGAITATEEGVLTAATPGYSLLKISYTSRYHKWLGRDSNIEDVQFIATEVLP